MPIPDSGFMLRSLEFLATFFIFFVGLCALAIIVVYILRRHPDQASAST